MSRLGEYSIILSLKLTSMSHSCPCMPGQCDMTTPLYRVKEAVLQVTNGRAMGAMGVLALGNHDRRPKKIEPQDGEVLKFTTAATPQSTAWLDQNADRYKCRHRVVSVHTGKTSHVIVGPEDIRNWSWQRFCETLY